MGVRQGENLSPFLYAIYLNDLEQYLLNDNIKAIDIGYSEQLSGIFKILVMMYADDTVLFSDTEEGLRTALISFQNYCEKWKLKVNSSKTKVMVFSKRKRKCKPYMFNGEQLEVVNSFKYLGVIIQKNGRFNEHIKHSYTQAQRAMYALLKKCKRHNLPINLQIELFDKLVAPVLLYGAEIWGYCNVNFVEKLHLKFC